MMSYEKASPSQKGKNDASQSQRQLLQEAVEDIKNDSIRFLGLLKDEEISRNEELMRNNYTGPERPLMSNELLQAAIEGNEKELRRLLGCSNDHEVKVELLGNDPDQLGTTLEKVEDIQSAATYVGDTVLHILATYGHNNLVSLCYEKERSLLKSRNNKQQTPLHCAAIAGHDRVISELIKLARSEGDAKLKEFLRDRNCNEETALFEAARHGHASVASVLMQEDPDLAGMVNNEKISPLYVATSRGSIGVVRIMVEQLFDRVVVSEFYAGPNGQTALHAAVLRDAGQELQKQDYIGRKFGMSSKDEHLSHNFTEGILQLSSDTPLTKKTDAAGNTPLHFAASVGCHHLAELLLKNDVYLGYIRNSDGQFPVHVAASMGHVKTIIVFLRRCIDSYQLLDKSGKNFFHIAAEENRVEVFTKLLELSGVFDTGLFTPLFRKSKKNLYIRGSGEIFRNMINIGDREGNTPLHLAILKANQPIIRALLKYEELDFGLQNKNGFTAIDLSATQDEKNSRKLLGMQFWIEWFVKMHIIAAFSPAWFGQYMDGSILRTKALKVKTSTIELKDKIQTIGLGSVLLATVTFAAAFTVPGGYKPDNGSPVLGTNYAFKAFIVADVLAFACAFITTMLLIVCSIVNFKEHIIERAVQNSVPIFSLAAKFSAMALGLGLYVVLAPVSKDIAILALVLNGLLLLWDPLAILQVESQVNSNFPTFMVYSGDRISKVTSATLSSGFRDWAHFWTIYGYIIASLAVVLLLAMLK